MWDYREESQVYHRGRCNHCGALTPEFGTPDMVRKWMWENDWCHPSPVSMYCPRCNRRDEIPAWAIRPRREPELEMLEGRER